MGTYQYNNGGNFSTYLSHPLPNGIFLCAIGPVPITTNSPQSYGVVLQYGMTKQQQPQTDDVAVLYLGRSKPAVETSGNVYFETWQLGASWYPGAVGFDGTTTPHDCIQTIIALCRQGYLVQMQVSQGIGNAYGGLGFPAYYGRLQNPQYTFAQDGSGRVDFSATFLEVG